MKLNMKISVLIGLLSFSISLGIGYYTYSLTTKELIKNSGQSLITLAKNTADILDREMLERYREIEFAASMPPLTDPNSSREEKRAFLEKIKEKHNHHEWIGYALPSGFVEAGTSGYLEGKNASARPWLPGGLKGPYIGDVHDALLLAKLLPNNSGEAIYFTDVAFPVKSQIDGEILGVLCTHLMWQWTRDIIRSIEKEHGIDIFLLSKDGLILVGPNKNERKQLSDISPNAANAFTDKTEYKVINWLSNKNFLTAHTISNGFDEYKGFGWKVIVRQSVDDAFKEVDDNKKNILIYSILAGLLGAIIGIILSNKITLPLRNLSENVENIKNGKLTNFNNKTSKDEIGILQKALIDLSNSLSKETSLKNQAEEKVEIALSIFDQSLEGILITDKNNNIILINKAFTSITGYAIDDVYGKNPNILNSGEQDEAFYANMWKAIKESGKYEGDLINRKRDGSTYLENLRISTLKDEKGEIKYYFAVFSSGF